MSLELSKSLAESQFVVGNASSQRTFLVQLMTKRAIVSTSSRKRRTNNRHAKFLLNMTRLAISTACSRVGTTPHITHYYLGANRPIY
jgi:hypothetical protein